MSYINIYTDGSSDHRTRLGGWSTIIDPECRLLETAHIEYGFKSDTTNNQMEAYAILHPIILLKDLKDVELRIHSDSQYVCKGMNEWRFNWAKQGRLNEGSNEIKNVKWWQSLIKFHEEHGNVSYHWVRGHNGHTYNEIADKFASMGRKKEISKNENEKYIEKGYFPK